jgi:hypothetical protein
MADPTEVKILRDNANLLYQQALAERDRLITANPGKDPFTIKDANGTPILSTMLGAFLTAGAALIVADQNDPLWAARTAAQAAVKYAGQMERAYRILEFRYTSDGHRATLQPAHEGAGADCPYCVALKNAADAAAGAL